MIYYKLFYVCSTLQKYEQMPIQPVLSQFNPATKFLLLICLFLVFLGVASVAQVVILASYADIKSITDMAALTDYTNPNVINGMKTAQAVSAILSFIIPALLFAFISSEKKLGYLKLSTPFTLALASAVVLLVFAMMPTINHLGELNNKMSLPGFMSEIETWMKDSEDQLQKLTEAFLKMNSFGDLLINLFVIALLAAIGEELFFRGAMQNILIDWIKNKHAAIWITAVLFSAMHVQFFGFLPRMLLGLILGYLYVWSNSLWVPILFHFINNGAAVVFTYLIDKGTIAKEVETVGAGDTPFYFILISIVASAAVLYFIYKNKWKENENVQTLS